MTIPQRLATLLLVLVTTVGATFMVLIAPGSGSLELQPVRVSYDAMAAILLLPWLAIAILRPAWRPSSQLLPAILVVLAAFAVSSLTSRVPRLSIEMLGYAILLAELYLLLVTLMRRPAIRLHLERLALLLCLVASGLYLIQVALAWIEWWGLVGRVAIPPLRPGYVGLLFGSPNPVATLVMMLGAFGLATSPKTGRLGWAAAGVLLVLVAIATFLTGSRGAWLGAAAGLVTVLGVALVTRSEIRSRARTLVRSRWGAIALVIGTPFLVAAGALAALSGRLTLDDGGYRAAFARASLGMFDSSPVTGVGPGTWGVARSTYTATTDSDYYIPHAHNLYVQTLAEFGITGIIAGLFVAGTLAVLIGRAIRSADQSRRRVALATLFALVLFAVQQLADVLVNVPALLLAVALPIAWLDVADQPQVASLSTVPKSSTLAIGRATMLGATVLTFAIMAGLLRIESAADLARRGVGAANSGAWSEAARLFGEAVAVDPDIAVYQFDLGVSAANSGDLRLAESSLSTSAAVDAYPLAWLNLAAIRWQLGDVPGTRSALDRAERLGLQRPPLALGAGWLHELLGDYQAAIQAYGAALAQTQTLANDPFWSSQSMPDREAAIFDGLEERMDPTTLVMSHLVRNEIDLARAGAALLARTQPGVFENLIPAWLGDASAWSALQAEAVDHPLDIVTVGWCRIVAAHLGDQVSVQRYSSWLATLGGSDVGLPQIGRIVLDTAQPLPPYLLDRYGSIYRKDVIAAQVVRGLPQIAWQYVEQAP